MQNFIKTSDSETADTMIKEGFVLVDKSDGVWTFINDSKIKFDLSNHKVRYSNQLHI